MSTGVMIPALIFDLVFIVVLLLPLEAGAARTAGGSSARLDRRLDLHDRSFRAGRLA
jgi:hypothetical protein